MNNLMNDNKPARHNLYDKINISKTGANLLVIVTGLALVAVVVAAIIFS